MAVLRRVDRRVAVLAAVALGILVAVLAFRWWDRDVEESLSRWAVEEVARRTKGTYRLVLGDLSFHPLAGSISFDSMIVATDTVRNRRREKPLPVLEWRARGCRVSGLDLVRLLIWKSFVARVLGCGHVVAAITLPSPPQKERGPATDSAGSEAPLENLDRPLGLSSFRISDVSLPTLGLTLTRPSERGGTSIVLERARFEAKDLVLDPAVKRGERQVLAADRALLTATGLVLRPDSTKRIAVAGVEASLTDSTLRLAGARYEPSIPEDEWVKRVRVRRDRIRFELDSLRAQGVAYRALIATGDIGIRAMEVEGARLDVLSDRRIAAGRPARHRTPQQVAARPGQTIRLDTILVTRSTIVYREREPERERPGIVTFDSVRGTILNLHLPPREEPLRIRAIARLMNAGVLTVEATVPLDAPDFRYELSGRLEKMPATALNRFLAENESFEFERGWIESIVFRQTARGGRVITTVTPRYRDLSVESSGDGGGVIGAVGRKVKEVVADALVVRSRNPEEDGDDFRTARTVRRYNAADSWVRFLWLGLRDALMEVVRE